ncbi:MAG: hypothetical protein Q7T33_03780 [Dehalococcoidia bacterium]|nr:hypothetical protein [Dehalococcoidia bacterium]
MSKLADRIRRASRPQPAPLGFAAAAARKAAPTMLSLVRLSADEAGKAGEAAARGADAVIIEAIDPRKLKEQAAKANSAALGVRPHKAVRQAVASLREAGADFAVVDTESALAESLLEESMGYVLALPANAEDTTLRLLGDLGLDALLVQAPAEPVTVERLLELRRIAVLSRTPLLAEIPADADASLLQVLRDSGVAGVVIEGSALGKLEALRERIAALPPRGRKRQEHTDAVVPAQAAQAAYDEDEDDED